MLNQRLPVELIIVDMNCPNKAYNWACTRLKHSRPVKMDVPKDHWNLCESRNFGYKHAQGDTFLFVDADTVLSGLFLIKTLPELGENNFITGTMGRLINDQIVYHCSGCLLVHRRHFEQVKGYNEALTAGWGFDDFDIRNRLEGLGLQRKEFDKELIKSLGHNMKSRNQYHEGTVHETNAKNHEIAKVKFKGI